MYPSDEKPYAGIFIKNQYEYLRDVLKKDIEIFYMKRTFTAKIGSIIKYLRAFILFIPYYLKNYDIIHVHHFFPIYILAYCYKILHPETTIIVTFHGGDTVEKINGGAFRRILVSLAKKCDYVISVGKDLGVEIEKKLLLKVNRVLSAGINKRTFYKLDDIEKEYDFIFAGSFYFIKGIDILLNAIEKLNDRKIKFCFVGSGPYYEQINQLSKTYNITIKTNQTQEQLRDLYNRSKFLILPSRADAFGLVVTEALYCGTPAIVSNIGGLKEQIIDGVNGFILENNTPEDIYNKISSLMQISDEEYKRLANNAENSNASFSLEYVCNELLDIYKHVISDEKN